ncbi:transposase [Aquamicrobium defluvii]|uniref:transposase n=1 Tax=Aquamicrobium defluvii TaxID=69279 RepID=UPI000A3E5825|nr:transposase [Aquamicrobium defluvii]
MPFAGHVRPENRKEDRIDRRELANKSDRRRVVVALRERGGRTLSFVRHREAEGVEIARARMVANAKLFADEATHWDVLEAQFDTGRINHSLSYSDGHGKHTNWMDDMSMCWRQA